MEWLDGYDVNNEASCNIIYTMQCNLHYAKEREFRDWNHFVFQTRKCSKIITLTKCSLSLSLHMKDTVHDKVRYHLSCAIFLCELSTYISSQPCYMLGSWALMLHKSSLFAWRFGIFSDYRYLCHYTCLVIISTQYFCPTATSQRYILRPG